MFPMDRQGSLNLPDSPGEYRKGRWGMPGKLEVKLELADQLPNRADYPAGLPPNRMVAPELLENLKELREVFQTPGGVLGQIWMDLEKGVGYLPMMQGP